MCVQSEVNLYFWRLFPEKVADINLRTYMKKGAVTVFLQKETASSKRVLTLFFMLLFLQKKKKNETTLSALIRVVTDGFSAVWRFIKVQLVFFVLTYIAELTSRLRGLLRILGINTRHDNSMNR